MVNNFIDLNSYDGPDDIEADVCIAGAGAAGITLAREIAARKVNVLLLESGGLSLEENTQLLYQGSQSGVQYLNIVSSRLRFFGGTTNHWGGNTNFNTELDYTGNSNISLPGWGLKKSDLDPWIRKTADLLEVDYEQFDSSKHVEAAGFDSSLLIENATDKFSTISFLRTQRRKFAEVFGDELKVSPYIKVFLHANLTHIQADRDGNEVDYYVVRSLTGKRLNVRAKRYVIACHAIENARLLLLSNDVHTAGIGNRFDMVGRYFMDHIHISEGEMIAGEKALPRFYYRDGRDPQKHKYTNVVAQLNDKTRLKENMLSYYIGFNALYDDEDVAQSLATLRRNFFKPFDRQIAEAAFDVMGDILSASRLIQERTGLRSPRKFDRFYMDHRIDQAPNPNSRVTLISERDALGLNKINLHWDLSELDLYSFNRGRELAMEEFGAIGIGRILPRKYDMEFIRENVVGHYHHLGTTRMGTSDSQGVVDGDCKVYDLPNLFIAGSSTFPTAGASGPTMSIVAMAMRLGDKIATELGA